VGASVVMAAMAAAADWLAAEVVRKVRRMAANMAWAEPRAVATRLCSIVSMQRAPGPPKHPRTTVQRRSALVDMSCLAIQMNRTQGQLGKTLGIRDQPWD